MITYAKSAIKGGRNMNDNNLTTLPETKPARRKRRWLWLILPLSLLTLILIVFSFPGAVIHSPKRHIAEVEKRINQRVFTRCDKFEKVTLKPLYDEHNRFRYVLAEFAPEGFLIVKVHAANLFSVERTIYLKPVKPETYGYKERDSELEPVYHSAYHLNNIGNEKLRFLTVKNSQMHGFIPAVKRDNAYLNLLSNELIPLDYYKEEKVYEAYRFWYLDKHFHRY